MNFSMKTYETDVLILGSGISGCGAAIAAKREGVDVRRSEAVSPGDSGAVS